MVKSYQQNEHSSNERVMVLVSATQISREAIIHQCQCSGGGTGRGRKEDIAG